MTTEPLAELVFDGTAVYVPNGCGTAAPGQMDGTPLERLAELAGRECYDSLGRGRSSVDFHRHILDVGHLSIYEHCPFTVAIPGVARDPDELLAFANRPGVYLRVGDFGDYLRVSMNLRVLLDWQRWRPPHGDPRPLPAALQDVGHRLAPRLFAPAPDWVMVRGVFPVVSPVDDEERWITLRLVGSRGFSHELVRHGDRTAISQRSTRYVDESESDWVMHPLIRAACDTHRTRRHADFVREARALYRDSVDVCEGFLLGDAAGAGGASNRKDVDRGTARKQARGAARGWLGNALRTSLIFSASVAQWRRMLFMRCHPAADAEIREVFAAALRVLQTSRYAQGFADLSLVPSSDGLGEVLAGGAP